MATSVKVDNKADRRKKKKKEEKKKKKEGASAGKAVRK